MTNPVNSRKKYTVTSKKQKVKRKKEKGYRADLQGHCEVLVNVDMQLENSHCRYPQRNSVLMSELPRHSMHNSHQSELQINKM